MVPEREKGNPTSIPCTDPARLSHRCKKWCDCISNETSWPVGKYSGEELAGNLCHLDLLHWTGRGEWPAHNDKDAFIYQGWQLPGMA